MKLSKYEQETIILYNQAEPTARGGAANAKKACTRGRVMA